MTGAAALLPQHQQLIDGSAMAPEVVEARGYRSLTTKAVVRGFGFAASQANVPGLLIPVWNVAGDLPVPARSAANQRWQTHQVRNAGQVAHGARRAARRAEPAGRPEYPTLDHGGCKKGRCSCLAGMCCIAILGVGTGAVETTLMG